MQENTSPDIERDTATGPGLDRRSFVKLAGSALAATVVVEGSDAASAATSGYGAGGFGDGGYGQSNDTDASVAVSTAAASAVGTDAATLEGTLDDLGGAASAECSFEWRAVGASSWTATATQTLSTTGAFSATVSGLSSGTDYEYRAVAAASDGDAATGSTVAFTTDSANAAPAIDAYTVREAGSPNPHAEITADWAVSDADGNLDAVTVAVVDGSGTTVDSATSGASGASASGTEQFKIKHAKNQSFDVTLTVTDTAGAETTATRTVTE